MKSIYLAASFILFILTPFSACAAGSLLRIACGNDFAGVEVAVDVVLSGKLKGQCPLDVQVPEGNLQVIFRKKQNENIHQVFISEFWIGEGVVKKVDVPNFGMEGWRIKLTDEAIQKEGKSFAKDIKAAKAGNAEAMANVGHLYEIGGGVAKNVDTAISWYTKAAEAGNARGMMNLGVLYGAGDEVTLDIETSYYWLRKATALGNQSAEKYMAALQAKEAAKAELEAAKAKAGH